MEEIKKPLLDPHHLQWWSCPKCGKNLFMIKPDAVIYGMQIKCRGCRKLINVSL